MKLRTIKKYLFKEINLITDKKCKPAQNSYLWLEFSEHKKYRKPFKGLNFHRKMYNNMLVNIYIEFYLII